MHRWTVRAARVALIAAGVSAAGAGVANADHTSGDFSILGGNQFRIPIIAPIGLFGNHVNVLSSMVPSGYRLSNMAMDNDTDVQPQMDICGNAIAGSNGVGTAACKGDAAIGGPVGAAPVAAAWAPPADDSNATVGAPTAGVGAPGSPIAAAPAVAPAAAQFAAPPAAPPAAPAEAPAIAPPAAPAIAPADAPVMAPSAPIDAPAVAPVDVQNQVPAAAPIAAPACACAPEAPVMTPAEPPAAAPVEPPAVAPVEPPAAAPVEAPVAAPVEAPIMAPTHEMSTSGDFSIAGGNQVKAPVRAPIRICGNAGALGGIATATCEGRASSGRFGAHHAFRTLGLAGLLG